MKFSRFLASALSLMLVSGEDGVIATPHCSFASSTQYTIHTSGNDTFGCRITTSLLRFIYQNNYLN